MQWIGSLALLLCGILHYTLGSTSNPFRFKGLEDSLMFLYEKSLALEEIVTTDLAQKIKGEIEDELAVKLAEMEASFANKHNDLSKRQQDLEEMTLKEKGEILYTMSVMSTACIHSCEEVSERLLKEKTERLLMDNQILMEVHELQKRALAIADEINNVKNEIRSLSDGGRNKTDMLEVKISDTKDLAISCLESQRNTEDAILNGMSSSDEMLKMLTNHTSEISSINALIRVQNRCTEPPYIDNGYPIYNELEDTDHGAIITYACRGNTVLEGNSMMKCHFGKWTGELPQCVYEPSQCGLDLRKAGISGSGISGGDSSNIPAWPWMGVVLRKRENISPTFQCGGTIIHRNFILATAYCMYWNNGYWNLQNGHDLMVRLGTTTLRDLTHLQEYDVRMIYVHPLYTVDKHWDYNIALLELEKPIDYNTFIRPICLPPKETPEDDRFYKPQSTARVIGWGYDTGLSAVILKETSYVIQHPDMCNQRIEDVYEQNFTDSMFCAAEEDNSYCPLTIGGPAMQSHLNEEGIRVWTQVGLKVTRCASGGKKLNEYFSHLQKLMPWIDKTIEYVLRK